MFKTKALDIDYLLTHKNHPNITKFKSKTFLHVLKINSAKDPLGLAQYFLRCIHLKRNSIFDDFWKDFEYDFIKKVSTIEFFLSISKTIWIILMNFSRY